MKRLLTFATLVFCATVVLAQKYMKVEYNDGTVVSVPMKYVDKIAPATHIEPVIESVTTGEFNIGDIITVTGQHLDLITELRDINDFNSQTATKLTFAIPKSWLAADYLYYSYTSTSLNRAVSQDETGWGGCSLDEPIILKLMKVNSVMDAQRGVAISSSDTISVAQGDVRLEIDGEGFNRLNSVCIGNRDLPDANWQSGRTDSHISLLVPSKLIDGKLSFVYDKGDNSINDYKSIDYGYVMNEMPRVSVVESLHGSKMRLQCDNSDVWDIKCEGCSVAFFRTIDDDKWATPDYNLWLSKDNDDEQYFCLNIVNGTEGYLRIDSKYGSHSWLYINYVEPEPEPEPEPTPSEITELWTGQFICEDWDTVDKYILSDGGTELQAAGAKAGDVLHFYIDCTSSPDDWAMLIFEGHWGNDYLTAGWYDIADTNGAVDLVLTDEMLQTAYIQLGWGGTFVVCGANFVLTKITLEHK